MYTVTFGLDYIKFIEDSMKLSCFGSKHDHDLTVPVLSGDTFMVTAFSFGRLSAFVCFIGWLVCCWFGLWWFDLLFFFL